MPHIHFWHTYVHDHPALADNGSLNPDAVLGIALCLLALGAWLVLRTVRP